MPFDLDNKNLEKIPDYENYFHLKEQDKIRVLIIQEWMNNNSIGMDSFFNEVKTVINHPNRIESNKYIKKTISGGKQTNKIYQARVGKQKVAIKVYSQIATQLLIHSLTSLTVNTMSWDNFPYPFKVPSVLGIGVIQLNNKDINSVLFTDWIEGDELQTLIAAGQSIPKIRQYARKLSKKGISLDPFLKNFKLTIDKNLMYLDMILSQPSILEQKLIILWLESLKFK
ncbi:MAG: hypothetical protein ACXAC7_21040 [Candidatus Hodarchaeales archaeon]|jgi:hypothetical protein